MHQICSKAQIQPDPDPSRNPDLAKGQTARLQWDSRRTGLCGGPFADAGELVLGARGAQTNVQASRDRRFDP